MDIRLDPSSEQMIERQLRTGRYGSPEEIIARALEVLAEKESAQSVGGQTNAVDDMLDFARTHRFNLGSDLRLRELIHEGHKY